MIEDFGRKIEGAAKDRWKEYRHRMGAVSDSMIASSSLTQIFPEPSYKALEKEGVDPWSLAFIRAMRDSIPRKPTSRHKLNGWVGLVAKVRQICMEHLDGKLDREDIEASLGKTDGVNQTVTTRIAMYQALGHDRSLRDFKIQAGHWRIFNGEKYNPGKFFCKIDNAKLGISVSGETIAGAVDNLKDKIGQTKMTKSGGKRSKRKFGIYRNTLSQRIFIGYKVRKDIIEVMDFPTPEAAREFLHKHPEELERRYEFLKQNPDERRSSNNKRTGLDRRGGKDITPGIFSDTFGFRGVQFGNYVEPKRRQSDLNQTYDALMDLAEVLGCAPSDLSLKGTLGLAFGARGRGGRNAAAAHYETDHIVINLTKSHGAGSLAHEWFHAVDNHLGRRAGTAFAYATQLDGHSLRNLTFEDREEIGAFSTLMKDIRVTGIPNRSAEIDKFRSSPYFTLPYEMAARSFEAWVIAELADRDIQNDYLANITDEDLYAEEAKLLGLKENRYPYPLKTEMKTIRRAFTSLFDPDGPVMRNFPGQVDQDSYVLGQAAPHEEKRDPDMTSSKTTGSKMQSPEPVDEEHLQWEFDF